MRVKILSEKAVRDELVTELEDHDGAEVAEIGKEEDLTHQAFGLVEVATVIAIIQGAAELASVLKGLREKRLEKSQKLRLQSSVGAVTIELDEDATIDDLKELVEPLFAKA
jgi:hypothetical protein